jgi:SH3 domain protein
MATATAWAQEVRYISDSQYVPLRSGAGSKFRIVHRGLPSGTKLTLLEEDTEAGYARVTTPGGTEGWIRIQYLLNNPIARDRLAAAQAAQQTLQKQVNNLKRELQSSQGKLKETRDQLASNEKKLSNTGSELTEIKRISSNALNLDRSNRQLVEEAEVLKSRIEVLEADNQRLLDSESNEAFLNGALAVALGVLITLIVPRIWPKRRPSSSWA